MHAVAFVRAMHSGLKIFQMRYELVLAWLSIYLGLVCRCVNGWDRMMMTQYIKSLMSVNIIVILTKRTLTLIYLSFWIVSLLYNTDLISIMEFFNILSAFSAFSLLLVIIDRLPSSTSGALFLLEVSDWSAYCKSIGLLISFVHQISLLLWFH